LLTFFQSAQNTNFLLAENPRKKTARFFLRREGTQKKVLKKSDFFLDNDFFENYTFV